MTVWKYDGDKKYLAKLLRRVAKGDLEALYWLGAMYDLGEGVPMDKVKASNIFKEAADKGHAHSMWLHACELLWGLGNFPQSVPDGMRYLDKAIESGSWDACITKARLYLFGELGVEQDALQADALRTRAKELDPLMCDPLSDETYLARIRQSLDRTTHAHSEQE
jgi:TPR repeat protein